NAIDLADAKQVEGRGDERILLKSFRGRDDDNPVHAGDLSRNGIHQHRRWVRSLAAGNVETDTLNRRVPNTEANAFSRIKLPGLIRLMQMKFAYVLNCRSENFHHLRRCGRRMLTDLIYRQLHRSGR